MGAVVLRKPEERVRRGWREKARTTDKTAKAMQAEKRRAAEEKEKSRVKRAAHNAVLLRVRGVKAPGRSAGVIGKVKAALESILRKK